MAQPAIEAIQPLAAPLGLGGVLARDVAPDVVLFLRDHRLLLGELALLREPRLRALPHEARVPAAIRGRRAGLDVQHVVRDVVEEGAVVAHQQ